MLQVAKDFALSTALNRERRIGWNRIGESLRCRGDSPDAGADGKKIRSFDIRCAAFRRGESACGQQLSYAARFAERSELGRPITNRSAQRSGMPIL